MLLLILWFEIQELNSNSGVLFKLFSSLTNPVDSASCENNATERSKGFAGSTVYGTQDLSKNQVVDPSTKVTSPTAGTRLSGHKLL